MCAVVGGEGFIGSQIVNELVQRGEYYVYVLDLTFRPERTNPDADCLIQVDMRDVDGLVKAFQGVDSVIMRSCQKNANEQHSLSTSLRHRPGKHHRSTELLYKGYSLWKVDRNANGGCNAHLVHAC